MTLSLSLSRRLLCGLAALSLAGVCIPRAIAGEARADHPGYRSVAASDGLDLVYEVRGASASDAPPLLILHGAYMSSDGMRAWADAFPDRRVILIDQRGHGRTGDGPEAIGWETLADDALAVLAAEGVETADVLGYSMGGGAALQMAIRAPDRIRQLVVISAGSRLDAAYPEVLAGIAGITPEVFDGTPIRAAYDRLSGRPEDFPELVEELKILDADPFDWTEAVGRLPHATMIIVGDHDVMRPEHAVELFRLRGGADLAAVATGVLASPPRARLLVLPAASHIGVLAMVDTAAPLIRAFLDGDTPATPSGFF